MQSKIKKYFEVKEFKQFLEALKEKYISYGTVCGSITLKPFNREEALKLSAFLSKNIKLNKENKIKVSDIQKSLDDSIFEGITVDDIVLLFFPGIKSNKELKIQKSNYIDEKLNDYIKIYEKSNIELLFNDEMFIKKIKGLIISDCEVLDNVLKALNNLPVFSDDINYLSIFSSSITGNPHYFDLDTHNSNTLLQFIGYLFNIEYQNKRDIKKEIFVKAGIFIDEVSNFVITYNLLGNELLDSFRKNNTPLIINLANIRKMEKIKSKNNVVVIVENPSFLSNIIDKDVNYSVIVTSGNSNLVIYKLLDKLKGTTILFNGDYDPEGLLIAQNFKERYLDLKFIGYNEDYYLSGISNNSVSASRMKKLDKIVDNDLLGVKNLIKEKGLASYQENNYNKLLDDIEKYVKNI